MAGRWVRERYHSLGEDDGRGGRGGRGRFVGFTRHGLIRCRASAIFLLLVTVAVTDTFLTPRQHIEKGEVKLPIWFFTLPALPAPAIATSGSQSDIDASNSLSNIGDWMSDMMNQATGAAGAGAGDGDFSMGSVAFVGAGLFLLSGVFAILKFLLAAVGGLFVVQEVSKEGLLEKALKRLGGEPGDVLEERRLKVVRLNDEVTAFQAALAEQAIGPAVGQELRDRQRRKRFTFLWQQVLNDIVMSDSERNKVEEAVLKYLKEEQQRQREFRPARSEWLSSNLRSSWFGSMFNGYVVTSSLQKKVRLQEELIANIRKALPDVKKFANLQKVLANVDISWLTDLDVDDAHSAQSQSAQSPKTVYVLSFDGDPTAAGASLLQQEVTAILQSTVQPEEVVLKLKSSGGTVTGYGLAAAQLLRFQQHNIRLVVCVDELAASGGYMMASCAQRVLCSPFAAVGSIGVINSVPNVADRLESEGVKVIQTTAGEWKRTIDPFQRPNENQLAKAEEDVNRIYRQFSAFVKKNRPGLNIEEVATGEVWFGNDALEKGLVDELQTSSEYILQHIRQGHEVLEVTYKKKTEGLGALSALGTLAALKDLSSLSSTSNLRSLSSLALDDSGLQSLQNLSSRNWPSGLPEPRVEAPSPWTEARLNALRDLLEG